MNKTTLIPILLHIKEVSPLVVGQDKKLWIIENNKNKLPQLLMPQHLYLCSTLPIKEGDWIYDRNSDKKIIKWFIGMMISGTMKILFTTDPKLIARGVHAIDGKTKCFIPNLLRTEYPNIEVNFLEEFCKRYNQKDNQKANIQKIYDKFKFNKDEFIKCTHCNGHGMFHISEINRKVVDVEKLKLLCKEAYRQNSEYDMGTLQDWQSMFEEWWNKEGHNQALQSNAGWFSLEDVKKLLIEREKHSDYWSKIKRLNIDEWLNSQIKSFIQSQLKTDIVIECEMEDVPDLQSYNESSEICQNISVIKLGKDGRPIIYFK